MGIGAKNLVRVLELCRQGLLKPGASIIELGAQEVYCRGMEKDLGDFIAYFNDHRSDGWAATPLDEAQVAKLADQGFASTLFRLCGFSYQALDIFDGDGVTLFDLNLHPVPPELAGRFDLVTNFGTTEHVINQQLAMTSMHELARPDGILYHDLPLGGYHTHGYFNYNPLFFEHLAQANGYDVLLHHFSLNVDTVPTPRWMSERGYARAGWIDEGIECIFRKVGEAPFRLPLETGTSLGVNPEVWKGDDPYARERVPIVALHPSASTGRVKASQRVAPHVPGALVGVSGWELQRELMRRYAHRLKRMIGAA